MRPITSVDLFCIVREFQALIGARVEKIYQPKKGELLIILYNKSFGKTFLRIIAGVSVFLTKSKRDYANFPPHFCMFLRKHLRGAVIKSIKQRRGDRVIELIFETKDGIKILISELFGPGNAILCDGEYKIIAVQQVQIFKTRKLIVHSKYEPPEPTISALSVNSITFKRALATSEKDSIVKALAVTIGLGGKYAEEICARAKVGKDSRIDDLSRNEYDTLYSSLDALIRQFKYKPYKPQVIFKNDVPDDYTPVPFSIYEGAVSKGASSFNEALDEYYTALIVEGVVKEKEKIAEKETERLQAIKERQEETIKTYGHTASKKRLTAEQVLDNIDVIEQIRLAINSARDKGDSWDEINRKLEKDKEKGINAASLVKRIDSTTKAFVLDSEPEIAISLYESAGKQASELYDRAKKLEVKADSALDHLRKTDDRIYDSERTVAPALTPQEAPRQVIADEPKSWFEKFKYFHTSAGNLVVCGKDATSNEILIKKYMEDGDIVFHADIIGSPFGLLKCAGDYTQDELVETATFVGSHSRAWREGLGTVDVYWVNPSQVSKEGGLQRGSFNIYGRRNYFYGLELCLAIGVHNNKVISGPEGVVNSKISYYVLIAPGQTSQHEFAHKIRTTLNYEGSVDEIIPHLPAGNSDIRRVNEPAKKVGARDDLKTPFTEFTQLPETEEGKGTEDDSIIRHGDFEEKNGADDFFLNDDESLQ